MQVVDATVSPLPKENSLSVVWRLAWPAVALNSLQVVNMLLDRGFIGHLPGNALTAHGGSVPFMFLMFSLAMSLGTASTALVSRAFGAQSESEFQTANRQTLSLTLLCGIVLATAGWFLAGHTASLFLPAKDMEAIHLMTQFLKVYAVGLPAIYVVQTLSGSMRGVGDTKSPMVISGLMIFLHILLNWTLVFPPRQYSFGITMPGFNLGLTGAALALTISAWLSAITYVLYAGKTPVGDCWRIRLPQRIWVLRILKIAIPAALMAVLRVASLAVFTIILKVLPDNSATPWGEASIAIAAMSLGFTIESVMFMPSFGLSMAAAALVGQSLGMNRPERAERLAWTAAHQGAIMTLLLSLPIFIWAPSIASVLLGGKVEIVQETAHFIRTLCVTEVLFAYAMVMIGAMQGAGDTIRPLWITIICMWLLRVPLAWVLALPMSYGSTGAWFAMSFTQGVQGLISIWLFKRGAWKRMRLY